MHNEPTMTLNEMPQCYHHYDKEEEFERRFYNHRDINLLFAGLKINFNIMIIIEHK